MTMRTNYRAIRNGLISIGIGTALTFIGWAETTGYIGSNTFYGQVIGLVGIALIGKGAIYDTVLCS